MEYLSQRVVLVKEKVASNLDVPNELFHGMELDALASYITDTTLFRLKAYVYRNKHVESITHLEPQTWWDHFKLEVMPKWFTSRFPVKYKETKWDIRQIWSDVPESMFPNREITYQVANYNPISWHD